MLNTLGSASLTQRAAAARRDSEQHPNISVSGASLCTIESRGRLTLKAYLLREKRNDDDMNDGLLDVHLRNAALLDVRLSCPNVLSPLKGLRCPSRAA
mmetsp:Transcript_47299/g.101272  ORF Transcript_47299/g.101272 Transcript_47299/m.101272 type:complete len:98 (+) Transcript_47299:1306-1599(+)